MYTESFHRNRPSYGYGKGENRLKREAKGRSSEWKRLHRQQTRRIHNRAKEALLEEDGGYGYEALYTEEPDEDILMAGFTPEDFQTKEFDDERPKNDEFRRRGDFNVETCPPEELVIWARAETPTKMSQVCRHTLAHQNGITRIAAGESRAKISLGEIISQITTVEGTLRSLIYERTGEKHKFRKNLLGQYDKYPDIKTLQNELRMLLAQESRLRDWIQVNREFDIQREAYSIQRWIRLRTRRKKERCTATKNGNKKRRLKNSFGQWKLGVWREANQTLQKRARRLKDQKAARRKLDRKRNIAA
jgi:hypothetical protein